MKTRIWKKMCERVRIVEDEKGYFVVQAREKYAFKKGFTEWEDLNSYGAYKHALKKKHSFIVMILTRELGLRHFFLERRQLRKKQRAERFSRLAIL